MEVAAGARVAKMLVAVVAGGRMAAPQGGVEEVAAEIHGVGLGLVQR